MNEMFSIVIKLLQTEACVVVPGFGGFVANRKPASINEQTGMLCPPTTQIVFNPKLSHNDGLLCQAWASAHNCTLNEAMGQIGRQVAEVSEMLNAKGRVAIPNFGLFATNGNNLSFVSSVPQDGFSENFGLQEFYLPTLEESGAKRTVNYKKLVGMSAAAAAVAAVLFFPINASFVASNMASVLPVGAETFKAANTLSLVEIAAKQANMASTLLVMPKKVQASKPKAAEASRFYVVLQKFATKQLADEFVDKYQAKLSDELTVVNVAPDFYAVACASTQNAELANKMMNNVRKNSSFKETFILYR